MSREIKFRVWDKRKKHFCRSFNYEGCLLDDIAWASDVDEYAIQQFTGLKDLTGKDIYEGDILGREGYSSHVVVWNKAGFYSYRVNYGPSASWPMEQESVTIYEDVGYTVIGNIFENPELLS